jgi:hypothetical protein
MHRWIFKSLCCLALSLALSAEAAATCSSTTGKMMTTESEFIFKVVGIVLDAVG